MLRFFRQLRHSLLEQNKVRRYLVYAFGEVSLVMIGILLAVQVNNWNEERVLKELEHQVLLSLNSELKENKKVLNDCVSEINIYIRNADSLRSYLGPEPSTISIDSVNTWIGRIGSTQRCQIVTDVLDELRASGNLQVINSVEVRRNIGQWSTSYNETIREENVWAREVTSEFFPYTTRWVSWDDIDYIFATDQTLYFESKFDVDPRKMLQELEFSNKLAQQYYRIWRAETRLKDLVTKTEELIKLINQEL